MYFLETIAYDGNHYSVTGSYEITDESFDHAFGVEKCYSCEIDDLEILEAWEDNERIVAFDNKDSDLISALTRIVKEGLLFSGDYFEQYDYDDYEPDDLRDYLWINILNLFMKRSGIVGNNQKTVVIFNSPPNSGKDVAVQYLRGYFGTGEVLAFKDELYLDTSRHFDVDVEDLVDYHSDRDLKELPNTMFPKYQSESLKQYFFSLLYVIGVIINNRHLMSLGYYSSREALIHVSEDLIKPKCGEDHYGRQLAYRIEQSSETFFFTGDGGFKFEVVPLLEMGYQVIIAQLERSGATFDGDSRSLLNKDDFKEYSNIKFCKVDNNGSLDDLYNCIVDLSYDIVLDKVKEHYGGAKDDYQIIHI